MKLISSTNNDLIKSIVKLQKANERKHHNLIVIEGYREINLAFSTGIQIVKLFFCNKYINDSISRELLNTIDTEKIEVTEAVYAKIAYREAHNGLIALAVPRILGLQNVILSKNPLVVVLETVEKPGNLGAILRTADAAKVDAIIVCDNKTDIYNPNAIRSSLGAVFTNQIVCCSNEEALKWLQNNNMRVVAACLDTDCDIYNSDFTKPTAVVLGSEADGLSLFWLEKSDEKIKIPMNGMIDSLNVSVSTAIIVFEAFRQRKTINILI